MEENVRGPLNPPGIYIYKLIKYDTLIQTVDGMTKDFVGETTQFFQDLISLKVRNFDAD